MIDMLTELSGTRVCPNSTDRAVEMSAINPPETGRTAPSS